MQRANVWVFRNVVDTKTFPSARSDPTFGFFAVHVRLWKRHECGSFHVFTLTYGVSSSGASSGSVGSSGRSSRGRSSGGYSGGGSSGRSSGNGRSRGGSSGSLDQVAGAQVLDQVAEAQVVVV